jgi:hypothetical protein
VSSAGPYRMHCLIAMHFSFLTSAVAVCIGMSLCEASDRLKVIAPPAGQEVAEALVGSVASACNAGDFVGFMDHFTPSQTMRIRRRMEDLFITHQPKIEIEKVTLLADGPDKITFGVRYALRDHDKPHVDLASKIVARLVNGTWKLDSEEVRTATRRVSESDYADNHAAGALPALDLFNPPARAIDPNLGHLRGDIGIQAGRGCANGRCGLR